jgi:hypothetical protein
MLLCGLLTKSFGKFIRRIPLISAFIFGIGSLNWKLNLFVFALICLYLGYNSSIPGINFSLTVISTLWSIFLVFYFYFYIPPFIEKIQSANLNSFDYFQSSFILLGSVSVFSFMKSLDLSKNILISFSLGMFLTATLNVIYTFVNVEPPYYGKAYHWYFHIVYNSPGSTILASFLSLVLFTFKNKLNSRFINILSYIFWAGSIFISTFFMARLFYLISIYFFILYFILFFDGHYIYSSSKKYKWFTIYFIIGIVFLFFYQDNDFITNIINRLKYGDYTEKFFHHRDYWIQVSNNFWIYPVSYYNYHYVNWFHSFIPDTHRTSGPYTAIIAFLLVFLPFLRALYSLKVKENYSKEKFLLYALMLPFLFTTIPWESSEPQVLIFYAMVTAFIFKK